MTKHNSDQFLSGITFYFNKELEMDGFKMSASLFTEH